MVNALFKGFIKFLINITKIFLWPIDALVTNLFPDFSNMITTFNDILAEGYLGKGLAYFGSLLPPNTRLFVILYLGLVVSFYAVAIASHGIIKVVQIIKNIKVW